MSGGEKARVALSMFVLVPHNLLLLDEPSNHLDVAAVDALTTALVEYTVYMYIYVYTGVCIYKYIYV